MTSVSVMRDKYVKGWPRHEQGERVFVVELPAALERDYTTDAHFVAYRSSNRRRLTREVFQRNLTVELTCVVFDVDCAETHGTPEPAPESWRRQTREKVCRLFETHGAGFYYETKGGARVVYRQEEPTVLRSQEDAQRWSQHYAVAVAYLSERFGIEADPACGDWQRCFRLPRATRTPGGRPENRPTYGDANNIATLMIDATRGDVLRAKRASKAFTRRTITDIAPCAASGEGLLYHLLKARGDIIREHVDPGAFVIRCPNESEHSMGSTGDGRTLLYLPAPGKQVGAICCMHGHCAGKTVREWLRCFAEHELEAAREAAGIRRRRCD